jgi:putative membrane protein
VKRRLCVRGHGPDWPERTHLFRLTGILVACSLIVPAAASAHHRPVPASELPSAWEAPPVVLALAALALVLFVQAFVRLRRRGRRDHAGWSRLVLFAAGLLLALLALVSPLDAIGDSYLLSGHMLQHMLIADASPALLVVALRGPLTFFFLPAPALRVLAPIRPLRAFLRFLLRPWVSFLVWIAVMLAWHLPAAYDYTLSHPVIHDLEHATFVLAGTLAWTQLVDPARHGRLTPGGRILFAIGMLALSHPIIDALVFSGSAAYRPYALQPHRLFALSPLTDQRLAGAVMMVEQLVTLGTCIGILLWPYIKKRRAEKAAAVVRGTP